MDSPTHFEPSPVLSHSSLLSTAASSPALTALDHNTDTWHTNSRIALPRSRSIPRSQPNLLTSTRTGGIRRKRHRSASHQLAERLRGYNNNSLESTDNDRLCYNSSNATQWHTPQHSPQTQPLFPTAGVSLDSSFESFTVPTPPCSDSGADSLPTFDAAEDRHSRQASTGCDPNIPFDGELVRMEMSSLGYLLPAQYSHGIPQPESYNMDLNRSYIGTTAPSQYSQTASSSPALYQTRTAPQYSSDGRPIGSPPTTSAYNQGVRRYSGPYESTASSDYSLPAASTTVPPLSGLSSSLPMSGLGPPSMNVIPPQYGSSAPRHPGVYDSSYYSPQPMYSAAPSHPSMYATQQSSTYLPTPYSAGDQASRASSSDLSARSQSQRAKAQCWEHGCNGRQFSTFSNLLRHQREKSGTATKSYCPKCGAEFTRTTARNGHLLHDKCTKARRPSEER